MKKYVSILMVALFAILNSQSSTAQPDTVCPSGYTQVLDTFTVVDCDYETIICYKCPATGYHEIHIFGFGKIDDQCVQVPPLTHSQILSAISKKIADEDYVRNLCGLPGPCNESAYEFIIRHYVCWTKYNNGDGIFNWPCNPQVYCDEIWKYCYDTNLGEYVFVLQQRDPPDEEDVYCTTDFEEITDPDPNEWSDCGYIEGDCYP